jgi:hypothetical protein
MKSQNNLKRSATKIKGSERVQSSRTHAGNAAKKGLNGETGEAGQGKIKSFIVRNHMLSSRKEP